jgi:menaquinone-9 beta-reductase
MNAARCDAAVIGGGPAGCSAALYLAQRGLRVVLFESQTYPHDKLCGEFLSPECAGTLAQLGVWDALAAAAPVPIRSVQITSPDGRGWQGRLPGTGLCLSRKVLDAVLAERAQQAGVELREATTVTGLSGSLDSGFDLSARSRGRTSAFSARAVIGAHGRRGPLDRALKRSFLEQQHPFVAVKAHFHGPAIPGSIQLHTFPGGYCGLSEIEGEARIACLLVREDVFQSAAGKGPGGVDTFIAWMQTQNPALKAWFSQAERIHERWIAIAQIPFGAKPLLDGDVIMAGDAAGLIPPLAGNGISMALDGGRLAAEHLSQYLSGHTSARDLRRALPTAWRKQFGPRMRLGLRLQPLMLDPRAASLTLRVLNIFPWLGQMLVNNTRGNARAQPGFASLPKVQAVDKGGDSLNIVERRNHI